METQREDLVVILAGYADRMDKFFKSNPGFRSRIAHHIDFLDYSDEELFHIAEIMLAKQSYRLSPAGQEALKAYIAARKRQPLFANARSIRNALDRARLRQANRHFAAGREVTADELMTIDAPDILASRVLKGVNGPAAARR
jgi:ATP-dependent Clp protease ATP-binding subunit ClpA